MTTAIKNQDSLPLKDTLEKLLQIRASILNIYQNTESAVKVTDLPDSMIPTAMLLDITVCYEVMYDKLIEDGLLKTGNHKANKNLH